MTTLYALVSTSLYLVPSVGLLLIVFHSRLRKRKLSTYIIALLFLTVLGVCIAYFFASGRSSITYLIISSGLFLLLDTGILYLFVEYTLSQCFFIIMILECYLDILTAFSAFLNPLLEQTSILSGLPNPNWGRILITLLTLPLLYLFFTRLLCPILDSTRSLHFWNIMGIIPLCNYIVFRFILHPLYTQQSDSTLLASCFWTLCTFLSYTIILRMLTESMKNAALKEHLHISEIQLLSQQKQTEYLQNKIEQDSRLRHDMRHYLLALKGYIQEEKYDEARLHLEDYLDVLAPKNNFLYCENMILNSIVNYYAEQARNNCISLDISLDIPKDILFPETDLCIIFGNILENALEACMRQKESKRFLCIKASMTSPYILAITASNSYEGKINKKDGRFLSSKENGREGIGISSIQELAKKYNGVARFTYNNHVFKACILLNSSQTPDKKQNPI